MSRLASSSELHGNELQLLLSGSFTFLRVYIIATDDNEMKEIFFKNINLVRVILNCIF